MMVTVIVTVSPMAGFAGDKDIFCTMRSGNASADAFGGKPPKRFVPRRQTSNITIVLNTVFIMNSGKQDNKGFLPFNLINVP